MTRSNQIRGYDRADEPAVGTLYARVFGPTLREHFGRRWSWEFEGSPAVRRFGNLIAEREGKLVAHLGRLPTRLSIAGRVVPAAFLTDLMADPQTGGLASLGLISQALRELPAAMLFGAQPRTQSLYLRLGMRPITVGDILARVERPEGALAGALHRYLRRTAPERAHLVRRWMLVPIGLAARPFSAMRYRGHAPRSTGTYEIKLIPDFDDRFDGLWGAMHERYAVGCVHDRAFLHWRYREGAAGEYIILAATDAAGALAAATVLTWVCVGPSVYGKIMECLYRDADSMRSILRASLAAFNDKNVDVVVSIGLSEETRAALRSAGFRPTGRRRGLAVKIDIDPGEAALVYDPLRWYVSAGDGDEDFEETVTAPVPGRQSDGEMTDSGSQAHRGGTRLARKS